MSEMAKTMTFVAVAAVALAAAYVSRPTTTEMDVQSLRGQNLTKGFSDPDAAKRMRIVQFNEDTATMREFEVAEEDGLWTIPSKDGYPADAAQQMALAATSLMDLDILRVESNSAADQEEYGVVDPLSPKLAVGQKGVGTRVTMSDIHGDPLADLIVGRQVKDAEKQHYVREADRDAVYVVEIDPTKLSTNFEDWIEKDLLKINPWDIHEVQIKDYSAELRPVMTSQGFATQVAWDPRAELTLGYNDKAGKWTAEKLREFDRDTEKYVDFQLTDDQELNTEKLDALKTALDDLRIVDVVRKPAGLSGDLKAGEDFLNNPEARADLQDRGFAALTDRRNSGDEIISSEGEVICTMNNGVEYVLRFGDLQVAEGGSGQQPAEGEAAATTGPKQGVHRYLFVMARFNEDAVPKPELQELPALPEDAAAAADSGKSVSEDQTAAEGETAAEGQTAAEGETTPENKTASEGETSTDGQTAAEGETTPENKTAAESETAAEGEASTEGQPAAASGEDQAEAAQDSSTGAKETVDKDTELARVIAERKRIETENQRKLDQYQATLKQGRERVKELNARFGDWYYVVSNDVFQKIRLGRDDVIQKKGAPATSPPTGVGVPGQPFPGMPSIPGVGQ